METHHRRSASIIVIGFIVFAAACGGDGTDAATPSSEEASQRPESTAELSIVSPRQDQVIEGDTATVEVKLIGATISQQTSTDLRPDEGHLHVFLDDELVSMTSTTTSELTGLTPGTHLLKVEFVANDHAPFDPRIIAAVAVEVEP